MVCIQLLTVWNERVMITIYCKKKKKTPLLNCSECFVVDVPLPSSNYQHVGSREIWNLSFDLMIGKILTLILKSKSLSMVYLLINPLIELTLEFWYFFYYFFFVMKFLFKLLKFIHFLSMFYSQCNHWK